MLDRERVFSASGSREIVHLAQLRIHEHVVGRRDGDEHLLVATAIGVMHRGEPAIGRLDDVGQRIALDAQEFVQIFGHNILIWNRNSSSPAGYSLSIERSRRMRAQHSAHLRATYP